MDENTERIFKLIFLSLSASHTTFLLFSHQSSVGDCGHCGSQHILQILVFYRSAMSIICYVLVSKKARKQGRKDRRNGHLIMSDLGLTAASKKGE